jgi:ribose/xylose/arabinose/galactoside ABC-type transport system permease subunit
MNFSLFIKKYGVIVMLLVLAVVFSALKGSVFLTVNNLFNIARQVSMLAIVATGMTLVLLAQGIDLSAGSQISIAGVIMAMMIKNAGVPTVMASILGVLFCTLIGFINGFIITYTKVAPLIATLAMGKILAGLAFVICNGLPVYGLPNSAKFIAQGYVFSIIPIPVIIMLVIVIAGGFLLNKTYPGRYIRALGSNEEAARLSGINVKFYHIFVYTASGFLIGIAGLIMLGRISSGQPNAGTGFEMDVLTAVVLGGVSVAGGKGSISGAFIGVLIIGVLSNGLSIMGINDFYQQVIKGSVLMLAIIFDSLQFMGIGRKKSGISS